MNEISGNMKQQKAVDCFVRDFEGLSVHQKAEKIAEHFSSVSNSYIPVQHAELPSFLPSLPAPQVTEYEVYENVRTEKYPVDFPN